MYGYCTLLSAATHSLPAVSCNVNPHPHALTGNIKHLYYLQVTKTEATLSIPKCLRSDTGRYTLVLTNPSGSSEINVKATVLGKLRPHETPV